MDGCAKCGNIIADKIIRIAITISTSTTEIFVKTRILISPPNVRAREMPKPAFSTALNCTFKYKKYKNLYITSEFGGNKG